MKQAHSHAWHDVFISHTRTDREEAQQLAEQLRAAGLSVYLDVDDALVRLHGRELAEQLKHILGRCHLLLFVFSTRSTESRWMPWELGLAHGLTGHVLLWPLNAAAARAATRQEYLKLYDTVHGPHALEEVVAKAHMARAAAATAVQQQVNPVPEETSRQPDVTLAGPPTQALAWHGPWQWYMAWWQTLWGAHAKSSR